MRTRLEFQFAQNVLLGVAELDALLLAPGETLLAVFAFALVALALVSFTLAASVSVDDACGEDESKTGAIPAKASAKEGAFCASRPPVFCPGLGPK
jgi:hypothetical protein